MSLFSSPRPLSQASRRIGECEVHRLLFTDIYSPHHKNLESFVKTDFQDRGKDLGGIIWEQDPHRHREVARKLSPAFSSRSVRKMEPLVHRYIDYFVVKMKELGSDGVALVQWTNWLAMDLSADLAWNEKMNQMRDSNVALFDDGLRKAHYPCVQ